MAVGETTIYNADHGRADKPAPDPAEQKTQREKLLWDWCDTIATESDKVRRQEGKFSLFEEYLSIFYGQHWPDTVPSYKPPVVINELRTLILTEASDLTESQLRVYVMKDPTKGGRDEQAERAFRALWVDQEIDMKILTSICWALVLGTGFLRSQWDPDLDKGMGNVLVEALDPRMVMPDPDAQDDRKMAYTIVESYLDISEIRRLFPITGMRVKPESAYSVRDRSKTDYEATSWTNYVGPMSERDTLLGNRIFGFKKARARVLDIWCDDPKTEIVVEPKKDENGVPVKDENGNPILEKSLKAKYPNGRRIIGSNGVILYDGDAPSPDRDSGVVRVVLEPTLGKFWGSGFIQQTAELQVAADKLMSSVVENAIRLNNGIVKASIDTGLDMENFVGIPGQVVTINRGSTFEIMYPPAMPSDMVQAPWKMLDMQRRILGFPEQRTGAGQHGNVSPELTETEISQAMAGTRLRSRMIYSAVRRLAELIFARMASGYTTGRVIPAVEGEEFKPVTWQPVENPEKYRLYVDPSSFQVMSRTMLKRLGLALFKMKGIDRDSLLETLGWPDWKKTSDRMAQGEKMQMMLKMYGKGGKK